MEQNSQERSAVRRAFGYGGLTSDPQLVRTSYVRSLWITGYPEKSRNLMEEMVRGVLAGGNVVGIGFFISFAACPLSIWMGDLEAAYGYIAQLRDLSSGVAVNIWQDSKVYVKLAEFFKALEHGKLIPTQEIFDAFVLSTWQADLVSTFHFGLLTPEPLKRTLSGRINWSSPEILRAHAENLLHSPEPGSTGKAEMLLGKAIEIAKDQKALAWELRAATSLARLWQSGNRSADAKQLLAKVYSCFTEGFATGDLVAACRLLEELD